METFLQSDRIVLRALEAEDLDTLYAWENDTRLWEMSASVAPFSRKQLWDYINNYDGDIFNARQLRFMIIGRESGERIGMIDLYEFDPVNRRAYVGLMVATEYRRQGYAKEAMGLLWHYGRRKLGMHQLAAEVECGNEASVAMFRSCGFRICGRLRSWLRRGESYADIFVMQKL